MGSKGRGKPKLATLTDTPILRNHHHHHHQSLYSLPQQPLHLLLYSFTRSHNFPLFLLSLRPPSTLATGNQGKGLRPHARTRILIFSLWPACRTSASIPSSLPEPQPVDRLSLSMELFRWSCLFARPCSPIQPSPPSPPPPGHTKIFFSLHSLFLSSLLFFLFLFFSVMSVLRRHFSRRHASFIFPSAVQGPSPHILLLLPVYYLKCYLSVT